MRQLAYLFVLLIPLRVLADPKSEAREHVDRATEAHKAGDYTTALNELTLAYTLDSRPDLLYAIGQIHVKLGQCAKAITFYERFLATHPERDAADRAIQAIAVCKQREANPEPIPQKPIADVTPAPAPPLPTPEPPPSLPPPSPPAAEQPEGTSPFYADVLGDALVLGGVACGVVAGLEYRSARHDLDQVDSAATYEKYDGFITDAKSKRMYAALLGGGSLVLIGAGVFRYVHHGHANNRTVGVAPTTGGAMMTWSSGF